MMRLRSLLSLALVLALVVTSGTMAVARSQPMASGEMVICTGYGVATISVDAQGKPAGPLHPCPKCLAGLSACLVPPALDGPARPLGASCLRPVPPLARDAAHEPAPPRARGPPAGWI